MHPTERNVEIDGLNLHYEEAGNPEKPAVVIMHGWGCDATTVRSITDALSDKRHVISVDLPGHGASSEPPLLPDGRPWGVEEYARCIEILIRDLGLSRPALIGHSYGGRVAIVIGSRNPDIEKIVLVDSAGIKPKRPLKYYWKVYSFKTMKKLLPLLTGKKKAGEIIERRRSKAGSADYRQASAMMRKVMSRSVNQDLRHLLPKIQYPPNMGRERHCHPPLRRAPYGKTHPGCRTRKFQRSRPLLLPR